MASFGNMLSLLRELALHSCDLIDLISGADPMSDELQSAESPPKSAWDHYNADIRIVEAEREKEWEDNMNAILVVASLFAAFLSAFLVETTKLLREDSNDVMKTAIVHLSAQYNRSAIGRFETAPFKPTNNSILVNSLLSTSLALNLVAVVIAMLVKQWNREFDRGLRLISNPKDRALRQEFRIQGADYWRLADIVNFVPILVLLSVFSFIVGFFLYLLSLHTTPALVFVILSGITLLFYFTTLLISVLDCKSPFRSAASRFIYYFCHRLRLRFHWAPESHNRNGEERTGFIQVNESREKRYMGHDTVAISALSRLANIVQVTPRNRDKFYSIAQEIFRLVPKDNNAAEPATTKQWLDLLTTIDSNVKDHDERALWFMAAAKADESALNALSAIPGIASRDRSKRIPLHAGAQAGRDGIVQVLLAQEGVDPNAKDSYGRSPLSLAAENGHTVVVQLLLAHKDIEADNKDDSGRTPLSWAAASGHVAVVSLLLETVAVDVNAKDNGGYSALSWAAVNDHVAVVNLLLAQEGINADAEDDDGRTPLSIAAAKGQDDVVWLLLARKGITVNPEQLWAGQNPLIWAAENGHVTVVSLLLAKEGVDVNVKGDKGRPPLALAAKEGHDAVARLLLAHKGIEADSEDDSGRTPLSWAAGNGHIAVVRLLLEMAAVDVNAKDNDGWSPLYIATHYGHEAIVQLLLAQEGVDVNAKNNEGWSPLFRAALHSHNGVVQLLLAQKGVDVNAKNNDSWTPIYAAARYGHDVVVQLLLVQEGLDINSKNRQGWSPLFAAAFYGHDAVVRLLLAHECVDVNAKNDDGSSPLSVAAAGGHIGVVRLLLAKEDIDVDALS